MLWDMLLRLGEKPNCSGIVSELWLKRKSYEFQMYVALRSGILNCLNKELNARFGPYFFTAVYWTGMVS